MEISVVYTTISARFAIESIGHFQSVINLSHILHLALKLFFSFFLQKQRVVEDRE